MRFTDISTIASFSIEHKFFGEAQVFRWSTSFSVEHKFFGGAQVFDCKWGRVLNQLREALDEWRVRKSCQKLTQGWLRQRKCVGCDLFGYVTMTS